VSECDKDEYIYDKDDIKSKSEASVFHMTIAGSQSHL